VADERPEGGPEGDMAGEWLVVWGGEDGRGARHGGVHPPRVPAPRTCHTVLDQLMDATGHPPDVRHDPTALICMNFPSKPCPVPLNRDTVDGKEEPPAGASTGSVRVIGPVMVYSTFDHR
jgi:hypothetical protein